jgi:uncharacterized protein (DUF2336 family)
MEQQFLEPVAGPEPVAEKLETATPVAVAAVGQSSEPPVPEIIAQIPPSAIEPIDLSPPKARFGNKAGEAPVHSPEPAAAASPPADMESILNAVFGSGAAAWSIPEPVAAPRPKAAPAAPWPPAVSVSVPPSKPVPETVVEPTRISTTPQPAQQESEIAETHPAPMPEAVAEVRAEAIEPARAETQPVVPEPAIVPPPPPAAPPIIAAPLEAAASLRRKPENTEADPFAQVQIAGPANALPPVEIAEPDPQAGETARSLLDIMSASGTVSQPQERALAADTLLRLIPRVPEKMLAALAERVSIMETPPPLLVTRLIRDPRPDVAGPLLEKASHIPDRDLITVIGEGDPAKLRMIARRRHISPALVDALLTTKESSVLLTLIRNPGAAPSHEAFQLLCDFAKEHHSLQAPLVTRPDTPAPTAFELFWFLPGELRRFVLSRFLTDSENLNRILKIALATSAGDPKSPDSSAEPAFPDRNRVENIVTLLVEGKTDTAIAELSELAQICEANARRIIADEQGEPLTIVLKVMGLSRAKFAEAIVALQGSSNTTLRKNRNPAELQSIFDSMSFNKARVLLTYWDWAAQKSGPYTQIAA